ncbi:MAG: cysteine desulfurase [Bacteroidales bacterium]|jgi:cysteine desulfurase/selenocysteine lyase|nr:cysteine desulfurase [Bacteroidales bacterium]
MDIQKIRDDFPILSQKVYGKPIVYLDNGATTQKPKAVLDTLVRMYAEQNANIHRGVHFLSEQATEAYENARRTVRDFLNAELSQEIIFTSGATAAINLAAFSYGERYVGAGDEIIVSVMEHHSNIVPWQMMCERKGASLKVIPISDSGELLMEEYGKLFSPKTRLVAITHVSNTLGTVNPVKEIIRIAHEAGAHVLVDGAQSVQHIPVDVQDLACDFFAFSGHKLYGPTGIGVLYGRRELLDELPPWQGGGDMVDCVRFEQTTYNELPFKFEAGTANYIDAVGLESAIRYLLSAGMEEIGAYEAALTQYALEQLQQIDGIRIFGTAKHRTGTFSLLLDGIHPYDTGMILDKMGIAVRTGTHCTQPLMQRYGIEGTVRASFALYNTFEEADRLCEGLKKAQKLFKT